MDYYTPDTLSRQMAESRNKSLRMFTLRVIDAVRPASTTRLEVLTAVIEAYPDTTVRKMDREIDYLETAGLVTLSYCGAETHLQLTKAGIDLVESEGGEEWPNYSAGNTGADMTHSVTEQIKKVMEALNLKQTDLAAAFDVSLSRVKALTSGRVKRLDHQEYAALVEKFNISGNWLATGVGEMFLTQEELKSTQGHPQSDTLISLTPTEEGLICAYRRARHFKSEHSTAEDPDDIATFAMVEVISYLVDGLTIGSIQFVMEEAVRIFANATPFSRDAAWFQNDVEALHRMTDIQQKEQPE